MITDQARVFFDMDGVLADFDRGVTELCHMTPASQNPGHDDAYDDEMWRRISRIEHYYDRLELMPGAKEMFDTVYAKYGKNCEILTGIPRPHRGILTAGEDKIAWVRRLLSDKIKVNIVYRAEKPQFCTGPHCILIDDLQKNIDEWKATGGSGIVHRSAEETLRELERITSRQ